jgi:hypothetical protein
MCTIRVRRRTLNSNEQKLMKYSRAFQRRSNKRAPGKGGIPSLFQVLRDRPALPEHHRSASRGSP